MTSVSHLIRIRMPIAQEHGKHLAQLRQKVRMGNCNGLRRCASKWTTINDARISTTFLEPRKQSPFAIKPLIAKVAEWLSCAARKTQRTKASRQMQDIASLKRRAIREPGTRRHKERLSNCSGLRRCASTKVQKFLLEP